MHTRAHIKPIHVLACICTGKWARAHVPAFFFARQPQLGSLGVDTRTKSKDDVTERTLLVYGVFWLALPSVGSSRSDQLVLVVQTSRRAIRIRKKLMLRARRELWWNFSGVIFREENEMLRLDVMAEQVGPTTDVNVVADFSFFPFLILLMSHVLYIIRYEHWFISDFVFAQV